MKLSIPLSRFAALAILLFAFQINPSELQAQWSADQKISTTDTLASLNENMGQCLAVSGDSVHVVWSDSKTGAIYYRHSFDGGATWNAAAELPGPWVRAAFPSIAVSGATVHVAFRDTIPSGWVSYYKRSLDGGVTWGPSVSLGSFYWWPSITCSGSMVFVALNDNHPGNSEVLFRRSIDNGTTWDSVRQISNAAGRSEDPSISASNGCVHLAWNDNRTGIMQTWYRRSSDNGVTWEPELQLTHSAVFCYFPMVHCTGNNVDVVYGDRASGNFELFLKQSADRGVTWNAERQFTHAGLTSVYPVIARQGSNIDIVWSGFSGEAEYLHSSDGGATLGPISVLVPAISKPGSTFIVASSTALHTIWVDQRDGHREVYYKNSPIPTSQQSKLDVENILDFGKVVIATFRDTTIALRNSGTAILHIFVYPFVNPDGAFMLTDTNLHTIAAKDSGVIRVRFLPTKVGSYNGASLAIATDEVANNFHRLTLLGAGIAKKDTTGHSLVRELRDLASGITVQPNPASHECHLNFTATRNLEDVSVKLFDGAGRLLSMQQLGALPEGLQRIALALPPASGLVFLRLSAGGAVISTAQIVVAR